MKPAGLGGKEEFMSLRFQRGSKRPTLQGTSGEKALWLGGCDQRGGSWVSGDGGVLDNMTEAQPVAPEAKVLERSEGDSRQDQGALNPGVLD